MTSHYKYLLLSLLRLLREMGLFYGAIATLVVFFTGGFLFFEDNGFFSGGVVLGITVLIHLNRKDGSFLKHHFGPKRYRMFLGEYLALSMVYLAACIFHYNWQPLLVFLLLLALLPLLKTENSSEKWQNIPLPFMSSIPGLHSGFRIWYPVCLLCLVLIFVTALMDKPPVSMVLTWVYLIVVSGLQSEGDPPFYIRMCKSPERYIRQKITSGIVNFVLLTAPLLPLALLMPEELLKMAGAFAGGGLLYLINQLIYVAASNSRLMPLIFQTLSLITFVMLFFEVLLLFVLGGLLIIMLLLAGSRLKKDFVW